MREHRGKQATKTEYNINNISKENKMTTTVVLVCGVGCSGTSALAGVVHTFGVPMYLPGHSGMHPVTSYPLHEDKCFYGMCNTPHLFWPVFDTHAKEYKKLRHKTFGLKNTVLSVHLGWVVTGLLDRGYRVKIIASHRAFLPIVRGRMTGKCPPGKTFPKQDALTWGYKASVMYYQGLADICVLDYYGCSVHAVQYEELLECPATVILGLEEFLFADHNEERVERAVATIGYRK